MLSSITGLTNDSVAMLQRRGLNATQMQDFSALLQQAQHQIQDKHKSAKQVLQSLSADQLGLLQKAACIGRPINVNGLSKEGAQNLLAQPDRSDMVDLNNDGLVEIGEGKMITFPPVNAPASVKAAWKQATKDMPFSDKLMAEFHMNALVYGSYIDGVPSQRPLSPEQQWSVSGMRQFMEHARSSLDFSVSMDGWTHSNKMLKGLYDRFEQALFPTSGVA